MIVVAFVVLAGIGATARWMLSRHGPTGTLIVNVSGSFLLACTAGWTGTGATLIGIGALGTFTTFSTFAADTTALTDDHGIGRAVAHVGATLMLGIVAAWLGLGLAT